jgi:hypothetical protein
MDRVDSDMWSCDGIEQYSIYLMTLDYIALYYIILYVYAIDLYILIHFYMTHKVSKDDVFVVGYFQVKLWSFAAMLVGQFLIGCTGSSL